MRYATGIVVLAALSCSAGCGSRPPAAPTDADSDFGGWSWYASNESNAGAEDVGLRATWGSRKKKLVYLILAEIGTTTTTSISTADARTVYEVGLTLPKGHKAEVRIETADGRTGSAVSAGQSYDLSRGSVFVVLPKGEKIEMRQFDRDISAVSAGLERVVEFVREDQELVRMFAGVK